MLITAYAVLAAWVGWALMMLVVILVILQIRWHIGLLFWSGFAVMAVFAPVAVAAGRPVKCTACGSRLFRETFAAKHPRADAVPGLMFWATAVIRVLQGRPVTCMYCGTDNATRAAKPGF